MPSPRKVSPSPSRSASTSFLNDRSIACPVCSPARPPAVICVSLYRSRHNSSVADLSPSEHAVVVRHLFRDVLRDVPMFDDLAVLEPEDVHDGAAARARLARVVHVQDHVVAVREHALDVAVVVRKFFAQEADEGLEARGAVGGARIVLDVARPEKLRGRIEILAVDRRVVEVDDGLLVRLHLRGVGREGGRHHGGERGDGECDADHGSSSHMCDGNHRASIGKTISMTSRIRSVMMNGSTPMKMVEKLTSGITLLMTKTFIPTGGWIKPSSTVITMMTPNQIGSKPSAVTTGKMIGTVRMIIAIASIRQPSRRYISMISASTP